MSELDDFFAKKDKKKTKKSAKFTPDDFDPGLGSHPEGGGGDKKEKKKKKKAVATTTPKDDGDAGGGVDVVRETSDRLQESSLTAPREPEEDPEWVDFAQASEADYSGLRIQKLNIQETEAEDEDEIEYDEEGKAIPSTLAQAWNIPEPTTSTTPEPRTEVESVAVVPDDTAFKVSADASPKAPAKYIPPAQRAAMKAAASDSSSKRPGGGALYNRKHPRTAPDINNEDLFPTLGSLKSASSLGKGGAASPFGPTGSRGDPGGGAKLITDVSLRNKWEALPRGAE